MKTTVIPVGLGALVLSLFFVGCGTLVFPLHQERESAPAPRDQEHSSLSAEALAQYSMGVLEGLAGENEESLRRYELAIQSDPKNIALRMELAVARLHRQEYVEMDALLEEVLAQDPNHVRAYQLRALAYRIRGMTAEALLALSKAIELEPTQELHYIEMASIMSRKGDLEEPMRLIERNIANVNDRLPMFQALGELYIRQAADLRSKNRNASLPTSPLEWMITGCEEFPDNAYLLTLYGELLIHHKKMEDAIDVFARIEVLNPTDLAVRQKLAMSLLAVGNHQRATELLEEIAAARPRNHRLWYYLAELYEHVNSTNQALQAYQKAIDAEPTLAEAYLKKAFIYLNASDAESALETLVTAATAIPDDIRMTEMLAYVYLTEADYPKAIEYFMQTDEAIGSRGKTPLLTNFHLNYAIARQMNGEISQAIDILRKGLEERPELIESFIHVTFRDRGNKPRMKSALMTLESFQDAIPEDTGIYTMYALIAFHAEEYSAAQTLLERAESFSLSEGMEEDLTAQFYFWLGAASERNKNYDLAEKHFIKAIHLQPDHADAHNYLAYMHAEQGVKLEMAYDHVGVALAIEPENAAYIDTRGWIYYQQGKYEKAMTDIKEAARLMPNDPTVLDHLGDIYLALGDEVNAIIQWKRSFRFDPDNETVKEKLTSRGIDLSFGDTDEVEQPEDASLMHDDAE